MNYPYSCTQCKTIIEISKPMKDHDRIEHCPQCQTELKRIYEACAVATADGFKV